MQWIEVRIDASPDKIDALCDRLTALDVQGIVVEDEAQYRSFLEENKKYWDYVDEDFDESIRGMSRVKFYFEDSQDGRAELDRVKSAMADETLYTQIVRDEDWENNWKQYYKPIEIGDRIIIVPDWEDAPETDRITLRLDPGLIFGTGSHATTRMCLTALDGMKLEGKQVLDLGCGSGILAIAALLLGADNALGIDIDDKAPDIVRANGALNSLGEDKLTVFAGDVLNSPRAKKRISEKKYDIVLANIVADVIIALAPPARQWLADDGVFICSGIIDGRQGEVQNALISAGYEIVEEKVSEGWHCFICR